MISINTIDICSRNYSDFTVVYDLRNKTILKLENVAADIWDFIQSHENCDIQGIISYICSEYDCDADLVEEDVLSFINELYNSGTIQIDRKYNHPHELVSESSTVSDNADYEGRIISELEIRDQLYSATFELTYACNEKCVHCYANCPGSEVHSARICIEDYKRVIDELRDMNCLHLSITGGDPFVNPLCMDIFRYARSKSFVCDIFTNGLYLAENPCILDEVCSLRPRAFFISLYGAKPETHDTVTQVPGSFEKTIYTIKELRKHGVSVVLNVMILNLNSHEVSDIIVLAKDLDVEYRVSMSLIYTNSGSDSPMDYFLGEPRKIKQVLGIVREHAYSVDKTIGSTSESEYLCGAGVTSISIAPDGWVYPCISLKIPLGSIYQSSIAEIWDAEKRYDIVRTLKWSNTKECNSCHYKSVCPHCAGMSMAETGDMFSCNRCDRIISKCIYEMAKETS